GVVSEREEEIGAAGVGDADRAEVLGAYALPGERYSADDDQRRSRDQRRTDGLAQHEERDGHGHEWRRADGARGPRRPEIADGEGEPDRRAARRDQPRQQVRPRVTRA